MRTLIIIIPVAFLIGALFFCFGFCFLPKQKEKRKLLREEIGIIGTLVCSVIIFFSIIALIVDWCF